MVDNKDYYPSTKNLIFRDLIAYRSIQVLVRGKRDSGVSYGR